MKQAKAEAIARTVLQFLDAHVPRPPRAAPDLRRELRRMSGFHVEVWPAR